MTIRLLCCCLVLLGLLLPAAAQASGSASVDPPAGQPPTGDAAVPSAWPHYGCDSAYTSYNPNETAITATNVARLTRRWGIGCDDPYFSVISRSPAVVDGTLYVSSAGDRLRAHDAATGRLLWQFGNGNAGWAPQPVASADGIVFYMEDSIPTHFYAVDAATGTQLWEAPLAFDMGYNETTLATDDPVRGVVYVVEAPFQGNGKLYALNRQIGEIEWYKSLATDNLEFKGDHVLLREGKIFTLAGAIAALPYPPTRRDHLIRIDATSHIVEMTYNRPEPAGYYDIEQVALCNDRLIAGFDYQYNPVKLLVAYNPAAPAITWQKELPKITGDIACNEALHRIYVPTDPYLYALDATTGQEVWRYTGFGKIYNPSVANGVVYFISDTNMYALDETTGTRVFRYPLGYAGRDSTQVAIANGMLYFSGNGGTCDLFALGALQKAFLPLVNR